MDLAKYKKREIFWHFPCEPDGIEPLPTGSNSEIDDAVMFGAMGFYLDNEKGICAIYVDAMPNYDPYKMMIAESFCESKRVVFFGLGGGILDTIDIDPDINQKGIDYINSYVEAMADTD